MLNRLFRHSPWHYVSACFVGCAVALLMLWRNGFSLKIAYVDALSVAGAVVLLLGLLGLVAHAGAFDIFGYSFSTFGKRRYNDLYAFSNAKREKRGKSGWTFVPWIAVGIAFLLASGVVWAA